MVLRLDPDLPLLWRSPEAVQLGAREPVAVVEHLTPAQEQLLAVLVAGVARSAYDVLAGTTGAGEAEAAALLEALTPALVEPREPPTGIAVLGASPLAAELAAILDAAGALADGTRPSLVALVADWVVSPPDHGTWLRRDVPHLPIVSLDRGIEIGPFVEPGDGPCLTCVDLARTDADPAWPVVAMQLLGRAAPALPRLVRTEAAAFAARRLLERAAHGPGEAISWRIDAATGTVRESGWRRHPECRCAVPPGSGSARARGRGRPVWPRRATTVVSPG